MDNEREQERQTYRLCRWGFATLGFALSVACFQVLIGLASIFHGRALWPWLQQSPFWHWLDVPVIWGCLVGCYLLWGRWDTPGWQRRTGLLLVMGMVDVVIWLADHADDLGVGGAEAARHEWFFATLGQALGWAEFALIASLSCEVLVHLGVARAAETGKATRSLATTGAAVWMLLFCLQTDWERGWPLVFQGNRSPETFLLDLGSRMVWTITLIQVTALAIAAARQCAAVLDELDREDARNDPFGSAPAQDFGDPPGVEKAVRQREPSGSARS